MELAVEPVTGQQYRTIGTGPGSATGAHPDRLQSSP